MRCGRRLDRACRGRRRLQRPARGRARRACLHHGRGRGRRRALAAPLGETRRPDRRRVHHRFHGHPALQLQDPLHQHGHRLRHLGIPHHHPLPRRLCQHHQPHRRPRRPGGGHHGYLGAVAVRPHSRPHAQRRRPRGHHPRRHLRGIPLLQLQPGFHLHGRFRQPAHRHDARHGQPAGRGALLVNHGPRGAHRYCWRARHRHLLGHHPPAARASAHRPARHRPHPPPPAAARLHPAQGRARHLRVDGHLVRGRDAFVEHRGRVEIRAAPCAARGLGLHHPLPWVVRAGLAAHEA